MELQILGELHLFSLHCTRATNAMLWDSVNALRSVSGSYKSHAITSLNPCLSYAVCFSYLQTGIKMFVQRGKI